MCGTVRSAAAEHRHGVTHVVEAQRQRGVADRQLHPLHRRVGGRHRLGPGPQALLGELDRRGFAVSSGSSCTSSTLAPSHVLVAMGVLTQGNVRVSLSRDTTADDVERFLAQLPEAVAAVRRAGGAEGL